MVFRLNLHNYVLKTIKLSLKISNKLVTNKTFLTAFISWFKFSSVDHFLKFNITLGFKQYFKVLYCWLNFIDVDKKQKFRIFCLQL